MFWLEIIATLGPCTQIAVLVMACLTVFCFTRQGGWGGADSYSFDSSQIGHDLNDIEHGSVCMMFFPPRCPMFSYVFNVFL